MVSVAATTSSAALIRPCFSLLVCSFSCLAARSHVGHTPV